MGMQATHRIPPHHGVGRDYLKVLCDIASALDPWTVSEGPTPVAVSPVMSMLTAFEPAIHSGATTPSDGDS